LIIAFAVVSYIR